MYEFIHVWDEQHSVFKSPAKVNTTVEQLKPPAKYDYREFKDKFKDQKTIPVLKVHKTKPDGKDRKSVV